jgi:hypothetical protein
VLSFNLFHSRFSAGWHMVYPPAGRVKAMGYEDPVMAIFDALMMGLGVGLVIGFVVMVIGLLKEQTGLGFAGLGACAAAGMLLGLLGTVPTAGGFIYWIIRNSKKSG